MSTPLGYWIGFHLLLALLLAVELAGWRDVESVPLKRAACWYAGWVAVAALFAVWVWRAMGAAAAAQFTSGYLIETSLSADNLFLFLMLFGLFGIEAARRRRVLHWGVLGAIVFRAVCIGAGVGLLERFAWMRVVFAVVILMEAARMLRTSAQRTPRWLVWLRKWHPVSLRQDAFWVVEDGVGMVTVLLLALVAIEVADIVFALDSIPAVLSVTRVPFLAYTSNILAVMGLRALYFVLAGAMERLRLLRYGLTAVLVFVAARILLERVVVIPASAALGIIAALLGISAAASLLWPRRTPAN
jgi:tellurite resistance protein TerC